ncbi:MAG TPA: tRNA pseudouridine(38-40) synthase TruA [Candidatus Polarisedimenticolia bacterium]|jgi:tRNA pseudouridine38-40 synthase|nr:tRNA pseudouridine(38-40) synthase TruA [Candidatus Polarisedimenticolia bacterium]
MRNLKMIVAYVGTRYAGWQVQPGRPTVQGVLEDRISRMLGGPVRLAGAGRTDAGVHAHGQVANFLTASRIPAAGLVRGLNALLPEDIAVMRAEEVPETFHARADARGKEYRYRIVSAEVVSPFEAPFVATVRGWLDAGSMRAAARHFLGTHDFTSFCPVASPIENKVRTLRVSEVTEEGGRVTFRVVGDGFLRHMVRTLAGTLIWAGSGRLDTAAIPDIIGGRDRRLAGPVAPASGLVLEQVFYGEGT